MTSRAPTEDRAFHYIDGAWRCGDGAATDVFDPATNEVLARVPLAGVADVGAAVDAASRAFPAWRRTPPQDRVQFLFAFKRLLEAHTDEIARLTTRENGKTLAESRAELQRGIENV